jgi:hypothetical protein
MGITITDLIALAKAGYTPGQVKELITLSEREPETTHEEQPGATAPIQEATTASPEPLGASEKSAQPQETEETGINYKELYERSQEDLKKAQPQETEETGINYKELYERSQEDLKKAQEANRKTDASVNQQSDPERDLLNIFASY